MLKVLSIANSFNAVRCIPLLLATRISIGVSLRNRAYSSKPHRPHTNINQWSSKKKDPRTWLTKEETAFLNSLLLLVQERKFDDLFGSLNDCTFITPLMFDKLIQPSWKVLLEKEIELKEKVMIIMWKRRVIPTAYSITPMISLYGRSGDTSKADALLEMMKDEGIKRIPSNYNALMKCHANDTSKVEKLFLEMKEDEIKPNVYIYATMIRTFSKDLDKVAKLHLEMIEKRIDPNVVIYATMIKAFSRDLVKVDELFVRMKEDGIESNAYIYATMIKANSKELDKVEKLYLEMIEDGIKPNVYIYNTMIDAYAKNEKLERR
jgi:pentatricopeptide repeat protein